VNSSGRLRLGALFQDLDALAGAVAYKHAGPAPTIVTAAVDRITIVKPLEECHDLQLSGHVNYVGTSSMEIALEARRIDKATQTPVEGTDGLLLTCAFTMVARDPVSKKAMAVSPLLVESDEEKEIFRRGGEYKKTKKALAKLDLSTRTPNDEESDLIHQMWMEQVAYEDPQNAATRPQDTVYMNATTIQNTMVMQPQYRNRHSFMIFGGYLMKQTMELAFCCCSAFAHSRPTFVSLDPSTFQAPVPVGSILYLTATVSYTEPGTRGSRVQVMVESKVKDVEHGNVVEAGVFNYTFWVDKKLKVMPVTYSEFVRDRDNKTGRAVTNAPYRSSTLTPGGGQSKSGQFKGGMRGSRKGSPSRRFVSERIWSVLLSNIRIMLLQTYCTSRSKLQPINCNRSSGGHRVWQKLRQRLIL
jgi:acyl-coenzyme A thioesterase 9